MRIFKLVRSNIMQYKNRKTGDVFIQLALAKSIDTMKNQVVFCSADSESAIFTMTAEKFHAEYEKCRQYDKAA